MAEEKSRGAGRPRSNFWNCWRLCPPGIAVNNSRSREAFFFLEDANVTVLFQEVPRFNAGCPLGVVNLHYDLPDASPMLVPDAGQNVQFAAFSINLEQTKRLNSRLINHLRDGSQLALIFLLL